MTKMLYSLDNKYCTTKNNYNLITETSMIKINTQEHVYWRVLPIYRNKLCVTIKNKQL